LTAKKANSLQIEQTRKNVSRGTLVEIEARIRCVNDAELFVLARVLKTELSSLHPRDVAAIVGTLRR
jgi:hypothetical protein